MKNTLTCLAAAAFVVAAPMAPAIAGHNGEPPSVVREGADHRVYRKVPHDWRKPAHRHHDGAHWGKHHHHGVHLEGSH